MKKIVVLGSTGSIGRQTLEIIRCYPERFKLLGLGAGRNWRLLAEQIKEFRPSAAALRRTGIARAEDNLDPSQCPDLAWGGKAWKISPDYLNRSCRCGNHRRSRNLPDPGGY